MGSLQGVSSADVISTAPSSPLQAAGYSGEANKIRRIYDEKSEIWFFSVVDVIGALIQQPDYQTARNYWKVLKNRLKKEGSESVTKCNQLKLRQENENEKAKN